MNRISGMIGLLSLLTSTIAFASSPITIVNNTNMKMDLQYYYCNDNSKCSFVQNLHLENKGSLHNSFNLLYPVGMDNIHLTAAKVYDQDNNIIATLKDDCQAASAKNSAIIVDSFGTDKLYCFNANN